MTDEIKPCPFCGGTNIQIEEGTSYRWRVAVCADCGAQAPEARVTSLEGIDADRGAAFREWNTRVNHELINKGPTPEEF